ncbi:Xyloglucanase precursor [Variovorax sp. PBS-H4]|uniref:WD40/YVTN/BNR-like repeat-containing protein n=1 Tax=Variovorax sp. PBS-H4 TaxID=434008 RepID=UPI00131737DB|nr:hypothetical protein [Variovorax sp. PBS-H4]VTU37415.1 Xyloglucanase precursor [Variovorax sp. PBS-H4]
MHIVVGTAATLAWSSTDLGETWTRLTRGLYPQMPIWAISSHPRRPDEFLAGTDEGVYRWRGHELGWEALHSDFSDTPVWAVAHSPHDPDLLIAGTRKPASLFRSKDGGRSWEWLPARMAQRCRYVNYPRVTRIIFDPDDPLAVWASVEIDGVWHSRDGGDTWQRLVNGLKSHDIHGITLVPGRKRVMVATDEGLHCSDDEGETWCSVPIASPVAYTRSINAVAGVPGLLFATNGDGPPGSWGRLFRSTDHGDSWSEVELPVRANSTVWKVAPHPGDPQILFACTAYGQVMRSLDGGSTWTKLDREFGDIRSLEWVHLGARL